MIGHVFAFLGCQAPDCESADKCRNSDESSTDTNAAPDSNADSGEVSADTGDPNVDSADDPGDSGSDSATDTGPPPPATYEVFSLDTTLAASAEWFGLSVGLDGVVWGATSEGLISLAPSSGTVRKYGTADGLYLSATRSVLAHSDGTLWVGYAGDVSRQGDQFTVAADGSLTPIRSIDFTESAEITQLHRLREQPYGTGQGDVWMGTNEGLCLFDQDLGVFSEHAHPTHPHLLARGVAFTPDDNVWNGDEYQLSRWNYSDDGDLSPSADLVEYWTPWPVVAGTDPVEIMDIEAVESQLWLASALYGLARIDVGSATGTSLTSLYTGPSSTLAVRARDAETLFIGTVSGLWLLDVATDTLTDLTAVEPLNQTISQSALDLNEAEPRVWLAIPQGLIRVSGIPASP